MALYKGEDKIKDIYLGEVPIFKVYAGEEFCGFFTFSHENLISNSDLLIDSNSDGVPDGFTCYKATANSLVNGIVNFTATAQYGRLDYYNATLFNDTNTYYCYARVKSDKNTTGLLGANDSGGYAYHSGSGEYEIISKVYVASSTAHYIRVISIASSNWTPIEVDYIGAINITDLVSRGILPSGLTNAQYKEILDNYFNS